MAAQEVKKDLQVLVAEDVKVWLVAVDIINLTR